MKGGQRLGGRPLTRPSFPSGVRAMNENSRPSADVVFFVAMPMAVRSNDALSTGFQSPRSSGVLFEPAASTLPFALTEWQTVQPETTTSAVLPAGMRMTPPFCASGDLYVL